MWRAMEAKKGRAMHVSKVSALEMGKDAGAVGFAKWFEAVQKALKKPNAMVEVMAMVIGTGSAAVKRHMHVVACKVMGA